MLYDGGQVGQDTQRTCIHIGYIDVVHVKSALRVLRDHHTIEYIAEVRVIITIIAALGEE